VHDVDTNNVVLPFDVVTAGKQRRCRPVPAELIPNSWAESDKALREQ